MCPTASWLLLRGLRVRARLYAEIGLGRCRSAEALEASELPCACWFVACLGEPHPFSLASSASSSGSLTSGRNASRIARADFEDVRQAPLVSVRLGNDPLACAIIAGPMIKQTVPGHTMPLSPQNRAFTDELIRVSDNFGHVTWLGFPIWQNILDLWSLQEAVTEIRPRVILETGTNRGGSALFYVCLMSLLGINGRVVTVDIERMHEIQHPNIDFLIGSSLSDEVLSHMQEVVRATGDPVLVVLDSDHSCAHVKAELNAYHDFVTPGSLLLCQDGIIDEMEWKSACPGPLPAIHEFLSEHPEFEVDQRYNRRFIVTHHPDGWLRRRH